MATRRKRKRTTKRRTTKRTTTKLSVPKKRQVRRAIAGLKKLLK